MPCWTRFWKSRCLRKGGLIRPILLSAAAQLLFLDTPPHAAISLAVDQCRDNTKTQRFAGLTNAVLRRVSTTGKDVLSGIDAVVANIPPRLLESWRDAYGADTARAIAEASLAEAALDLSVKSDAPAWAEKLGGVVLSTSTVRLARAGRVEDLPGYAEGAWWVQDAAAALPSRMLGDCPRSRSCRSLRRTRRQDSRTRGRRRPRHGGRLFGGPASPAVARISTRLNLEADIVEADATAWDPGREFDAVLLDAPCSATGTIRRHPDILHLKRKDDTSERVALQRRLIAQAARLVKPGGLLVYGTCSLEPEEGEKIVDRLLAVIRRHGTRSPYAGRSGHRRRLGDRTRRSAHPPLPSPESPIRPSPASTAFSPHACASAPDGPGLSRSFSSSHPHVAD